MNKLKKAVLFRSAKDGEESGTRRNDDRAPEQKQSGEEGNIKSTAERKELEAMILTLQLMEIECVQEQLIDEREVLKDEFKALQRIANKSLAECKELIASRNSVQMKKGNTVDVIEKGLKITQKLDELDRTFEKISEVLKHQVKQKGKKFSSEQLDERFDELQALKQQIEDARNSFKNVSHSMWDQDDHMTLKEFKLKQNQTPSANNQESYNQRDVNDEEQAVIDRWKARDKELDAQILEIGDAVDHLGEVAIQIEEKVEQQSKALKNLHRCAEEAQTELFTINNKLRHVLKKQGYGNWLCKLVLVMILVGMIGYILSIINNRIKI